MVGEGDEEIVSPRRGAWDWSVGVGVDLWENGEEDVEMAS